MYCFHLKSAGYFLSFLCSSLLGFCTSEPGELPANESIYFFEDITEKSGFDFVHTNGMSGNWYFAEIMGAGGGVLDFDNDGDLDIYAVQGAPLHPDTPARIPDHEAPSDRLYQNLFVETGKVKFRDVTEAAGIKSEGYGMGISTGDFDNDGWRDIYVTNLGPNLLWRNRGDGTFEDATAAANVNDIRWSTSSSWFDWNRDGWLDLFVVNYLRYSVATDVQCYSDSSIRDYCWPKAYPPEPDQLFVNRGDGTFQNTTFTAGFKGKTGAGLGVVVADFNSDGWLDSFVANDADENHLWINYQGRQVENKAILSGVAFNDQGMVEGSMGVAALDVDIDGDEDLLLAHLEGETNTLYLNDGTAFFTDASRGSELARSSVPFTSFGLVDFDSDNDGLQDFFIANGAVRSIHQQRERGDTLPLKQRDQLFRNLGGGKFAEITQQSPVLQRLEVGRGLAKGDLDNDGDHDLVLFNNGGPARIYINQVGQDNNWIGFQLHINNRDALGAYIQLELSSGKILRRRLHTDGSYCAASDPRVLFGLGQEAAINQVKFFWPDGHQTTLTAPQTGMYHVIDRMRHG